MRPVLRLKMISGRPSRMVPESRILFNGKDAIKEHAGLEIRYEDDGGFIKAFERGCRHQRDVYSKDQETRVGQNL